MGKLIDVDAVVTEIDGMPIMTDEIGAKFVEKTCLKLRIEALPPAQPEYEPVKAEDFAKTMSENTIYSFMAWHGEALELMERQGFVICKKAM